SVAALAIPSFASPTESFVTPVSKAAGTSITVAYDQKYDVADSSLTTVACSDGANGLITKGYKTFGSVPGFPNIGGAPTVAGWNSSNCGKCYELNYENGDFKGSIYVTAVDSASPGAFNIGLHAMDKLTNGQAVQFGRVTATYTEVEEKFCA
ncbi:hypothetical protein ASPZODRAFT_53486, partial [Penicilliopsis zonata CBS 506.65]